MKATFGKTAGIILTAVFIILLWLPLSDGIFNFAPAITQTEKSALSLLPPIKFDLQSIRYFQRIFIRLFIDHFGFRNALIKWNSLLKLKVFKINIFPKVIVGKDNWLYLSKEDDGLSVLEYYRAVDLFSESELNEWMEPLYSLNNNLAKKGIKLYVVFAPMKDAIYPEYKPDYLQPKNKFWRLDQVKKNIAARGLVNAIDLRVALTKRKRDQRIFYKHDVHWNYIGGFFAYQEIAKTVMKDYPVFRHYDINDYTITEVDFKGGDLANLLGLKDSFTETYYLLKPRFNPRARPAEVSYSFSGSKFTEAFAVNVSTLPKAVVFHDSFFNMIKPFLSEHFSRMACFQSYSRIDMSVIDREKPDIVIYEMAEAYLQNPSYIKILKSE
jgi:hypothetical protein